MKIFIGERDQIIPSATCGRDMSGQMAPELQGARFLKNIKWHLKVKKGRKVLDVDNYEI
jgi:hypothetical protein